MESKNNLKVSSLKSHIGYHLRMTSNAVSLSFAKKLLSLDVTVAEWVILREMFSDQKNTSPSTVAELTGLTRGAVSKLIERLLQKNLVTRTEDAIDRRYQEIKLTLKAIKLVPKLAEIADKNDDYFFNVLTESEKKTLMKILFKLNKAHKLKTNPIK